jgi:hypothetical protein
VSGQKSSKPPIVFIALSILGAFLILFFGLRALRAFRKFDGPRPHPPIAGQFLTDVETIEDWMTIPFISHNYGVPPDLLFKALNIAPVDKADFKKSLKQLNDEYFPDADGYVLATIKATILAHPPPPTPASPPMPDTPPTP